jgi:methylglyoxal synthase
VGVYVQITNTGGTGLNIREEAGLKAKVLFSGNDAEVFLITDGPLEVDGYTWWKLTASYDVTRAGWAVQNFLSVISSQ